MPPYTNFTTIDGSNTTLEDLYPWLRSRSVGLASGVSFLRGQEHDAQEDFVQESIVRAYEYALRLDYKDHPIKSLKHFTVTTMRNYCEDIRRRDRRLVRFAQLQSSFNEFTDRYGHVDPSEIAIENVFRETLFLLIAPEIANFPPKQRHALLVDLANNTYFDEQPTPLQKAFQKAGIDLQDYQEPIPDDPIERGRFASNLNHAYDRVKNLKCVQQYLAA